MKIGGFKTYSIRILRPIVSMLKVYKARENLNLKFGKVAPAAERPCHVRRRADSNPAAAGPKVAAAESAPGPGPSRTVPR